MRYSEMNKGMYAVRTKELPWAKVLSGEICYVESVSPGEIIVKVTDDCIPRKDGFALGYEADDGNWYDVSRLVAAANSAITPEANTCAFSAAPAMNYRNFLGLNELCPLEGEEAIGTICLRGEPGKLGMAYDKVGYYIVGYMDGFYIGYSGYCHYMGPDSERKLQLQILRMPGNRRFYKAEEIVAACEASYKEDLKATEMYASSIIDDVSASASEVASSSDFGRIKELNLV